jgi:hypothetical protein
VGAWAPTATRTCGAARAATRSMTAADSWVVTHDYSAGTTDPPGRDGLGRHVTARAPCVARRPVGVGTRSIRRAPTNDELGAEYSVTLRRARPSASCTSPHWAVDTTLQSRLPTPSRAEPRAVSAVSDA